MEKFKELSFEEMVEVDGGLPAYLAYVAGVVALAVITDVVINWDDYVDAVEQGFQDGYNAVKK